jgi:hypothetical protein
MKAVKMEIAAWFTATGKGTSSEKSGLDAGREIHWQ